jgi:hypothetical protein
MEWKMLLLKYNPTPKRALVTRALLDKLALVRLTKPQFDLLKHLAAYINDVPVEWVTREQRAAAKQDAYWALYSTEAVHMARLTPPEAQVWRWTPGITRTMRASAPNWQSLPRPFFDFARMNLHGTRTGRMTVTGRLDSAPANQRVLNSGIQAFSALLIQQATEMAATMARLRKEFEKSYESMAHVSMDLTRLEQIAMEALGPIITVDSLRYYDRPRSMLRISPDLLADWTRQARDLFDVPPHKAKPAKQLDAVAEGRAAKAKHQPSGLLASLTRKLDQ